MNYHLQKHIMFNTCISRKFVRFKNNIRNQGLNFHYNIREDPMWCVGCVSVIWIPCSCSECLSKLDHPRNIIQYTCKQDRYKGGNQQCIFWPILGSYKNWQIIHYIDSLKTCINSS